jgi:uncharacterized repeat protein (TIGR03803 family)
MNKLRFTKMMTLLFCSLVAIAAPAQTFNTLFSFNGSDGSAVSSNLVQGTDGNLYGLAIGGGANNLGTFFQITPGGVMTTLYNFCSQPNCTDGENPTGLLLATDGNFYGTTGGGGAFGNFGTVFKITISGTLTTLHSFNIGDGQYPNVGLIQAKNGNFYGITHFGGSTAACPVSGGCGTVFAITPAGNFKTLHSFCALTNCTDGKLPISGLVQASNGNFYGTTEGGGSNSFGYGSAFQITPFGKFTTIYNFCAQTNCNDGEFPFSGLVQASNGLLYGTTNNGGTHSGGTVFAMSLTGKLTTIHNFCSANNCNDGSEPAATLIQGTNGNLFGTTVSGGANSYGVAYEITPAGRVTTLQVFNYTNGGEPYAGMVQASDGTLYGGTNVGGANGGGTVYSVSLGPVAIH